MRSRSSQRADHLDQLAALIVTGVGFGEERTEPESFLFLIDLKTGKVKLAWKE